MGGSLSDSDAVVRSVRAGYADSSAPRVAGLWSQCRLSPCQWLALGLTVVWSIVPAAAAAESQLPDRPNVVILLADDLGYGDLACYGNPEARTPNIDRLAKEGVRFTDGYASFPVCSPSRAGLLTGRNANRYGIRDWIPPNSGVYLPRSEVTLAEVLRNAGYRTGHFGKWHLNSRTDGSEPTPMDHGFDHAFYTQNNAAPSHLNPTNFVGNTGLVGPLRGASALLVADEAIRWMKGADTNQPFLLNVWFHEPHEPVTSADEFLTVARRGGGCGSSTIPGQRQPDGCRGGADPGRDRCAPVARADLRLLHERQWPGNAEPIPRRPAQPRFPREVARHETAPDRRRDSGARRDAMARAGSGGRHQRRADQ